MAVGPAIDVYKSRLKRLNPDDPAVIAAIDLVRWELSLGS
jgi:hypothetical protein